LISDTSSISDSKIGTDRIQIEYNLYWIIDIFLVEIEIDLYCSSVESEKEISGSVIELRQTENTIIFVR